MIVSRLVDRLKEEHWTGVFIELVIVILGVFIGMQVNNWNEARAHRAGERAFLLQLREEIASNATAVDYQLRYVDEMVASGRRALAYLKGGKDCMTGCEESLIDFFHASQIWGTSYDFTRYREAQRLGFPSNLATRDAVQSFYLFIDGWGLVNATPPAYRERVRGYFTLEASTALWGGCHHMLSGQLEELKRDFAGDLEPLDAASMLREIRADAALTPELQFWLGQNIFALRAYPAMRKSADAAMAAITKDIGDSN
jgi:hypothetical protein